MLFSVFVLACFLAWTSNKYIPVEELDQTITCSTLDEYTILSDNGSCWVIPDGKLNRERAVYKGDYFGECEMWIRNH